MTHSREKKNPFPIPILLLFCLLLLIVGHWLVTRNHREDSGKPFDGLNESSQRLEQLTEELSQSESSSPRKERGIMIPGRAPEAAQGPDTAPDEEVDDAVFPETEEFVTSSTLELSVSSEPGELVGWVSDTQQLPVDKASISLKFEGELREEEKAPQISIESDENGKFVFDEVPPGRWSVVAEKEGYASDVENGVEIVSGDRHRPVQLSLGPERKVTGKITDGENPIENARVRVYREFSVVTEKSNTNTIRIQYGESQSKPDGAYEIGQLSTATFRIEISASGYATVTREIEIKEENLKLDIQLEAESLLGGVVRGARGAPVAGAELSLFEEEEKKGEKPVQTTKSGEQGAFSFKQLPAGRAYRLFAKAERYAEAGPILVYSGTEQNVINMTTGGYIQGKVTDLNTGGTVSSLSIVAVSTENSKWTPLRTETNSEGIYRLKRLPAGTYDVTVTSEKYTSEPQLAVKVTATEPAKDVDFLVYQGVSLTGTVIDGDTRERLAGASVQLNPKMAPTQVLKNRLASSTDSGGNFRFPSLPQGIYVLTADLKGYTRGVGEEKERRVEILSGISPKPVEIKLYRGGTIGGQVTDIQGSTVENAQVQIYHPGGSPGRIDTRKYTATTDAGGVFRIEGIPIHQELHLIATAWAEGKGKGKSSLVVLNREQHQSSCQIQINGGGSLSVTVTDTAGLALSGANVSVRHSDFPDSPPSSWSKKTLETGNASFNDLPPGRVSVYASKSGYLSDSDRVSFEGPGYRAVTLKLEEARILTGKVITDRQEIVRNGTVRAGGGRGGGRVDINNDGTFKFESLGEDEFWLEVDARKNTATGGRSVKWRFPEVSPNDGVGEIVLEVPMTGTLSGRVIAPGDDAELPNFTISLNATYYDYTGSRQGFRGSHTFQTDGEFTFDSLPPGEYQVTALAPNFLPVSEGPFSISSPGEKSVGILRLNPGGVLKLKVVHSRTGEPVGGASASLEPEGPSRKSNGNGDIVFSPVRPGIYSLELDHPDYLPTEKRLIRVSRGKTEDIGEVELEPGAVLLGEVVDGTNSPLDGILVEARSVESDEVKRTRTDGGGSYTLRGMDPGGHVVTYSGKVNDWEMVKSLNLTVSSFDETEQNVTLWANSTLVGYLGSTSNVNVARSIVSLYPLRSDNSPITRKRLNVEMISQNRFRATNLIEGSYFVAAEAPSITGELAYWSAVARVNSAESNVSVTPGIITLRGRIRKAMGEPVGSAQLRLELLSSVQSGYNDLREWWQWEATTDGQGYFIFSNLPAGTYSMVSHNEELQSDILEIITLENGRAVVEQDFYYLSNNDAEGSD